jgi:hypothetical protein
MAASADQQEDVPGKVSPAKGSLTLWLWVSAGFLVLVVAWVVLFSVANSVKVESVPLAPKGAKP